MAKITVEEISVGRKEGRSWVPVQEGYDLFICHAHAAYVVSDVPNPPEGETRTR
jgi:hypothetical protein